MGAPLGDEPPAVVARHLEHGGLTRLAGDYWPVIKDRRGRRQGTVTDRYPSSKWMNLNICNPVLAPGAKGPVATSRFEWLREGIQECEARIAIERALTDERLRRRLGGCANQRRRHHQSCQNPRCPSHDPSSTRKRAAPC